MISLSWSSVQKPLKPATRNPVYGMPAGAAPSWAVGGEHGPPLTTHWAAGSAVGLQPPAYGDATGAAGTSVVAPCN